MIARRYRIASPDLFYIAVFLYALANNIQLSYAYTTWATSGSSMLAVLQALRYAAYALCLVRLLYLNRLNRINIWVDVALLCGAVVASATGTANSPMFYLLFFISGINTDFRKIVKVFLTVQCATFVLYLFCGLMGIAGGGTVLQSGRTRAFLGYGWVNRASYCLLFMTIELMYLKNYRIKIFPAMGILLMDIIIYLMTRTMYSMLLTAFVVLIALKRRYVRIKRKHPGIRRDKLLTLFFLATLIIGIILPCMYTKSNKMWRLLNGIVTGRLELGKEAIDRYGLHIWGNKLEWVGSSTLLFGLSKSKEYFYVDTGFLNLSLEFGVLFTGLIALMYYMSIRMATKRRDDGMIITLFVLFILFTFEPYVLDFAFNPFPLYFIAGMNIYQFRKRSIQISVPQTRGWEVTAPMKD